MMENKEFIKKDYQSIDSVVQRLKAYILFQTDPYKQEKDNMIYCSCKDIQILIDNYEQLKQTSGIDGLTGLIHNGMAYERFQDLFLKGYKRLVSKPKLTELNYAFITFDADNFTYGNTIKGHFYMDNVIKTIGAIIRENIRVTDLGIRLGGEEFGIVCEVNNRFTALQKAKKIKDLVRKFPFPGGFTISLSGGVTLFRITKMDIISLDTIFSTFDTLFNQCKTDTSRKKINKLKEAKLTEYIKPIFMHARICSDDALYKSKVLGKDRISLYSFSEDYTAYRTSYTMEKKQPVAV